MKKNKMANILIIDDDPVTRLMLKKVLLNSSFNVLEAENGKEGFSKFIDHLPDLVLMDVMMPVMNGYDATLAIRNYETKRNIPILMLTSLDDIESVDKAFDAGATDFITKPINWSLLGQRVRYALKSAETEEALRNSQAQLVYAQKLTKIGYWEWDALTDEVSGSSAMFELFGVPKHDYLPIEQFLANVIPKDRPIINHALSEATTHGENIQISFRVLLPDQKVIHIDCIGETEQDGQGKIIKIKGSAQDITRLHKAEMLIDYQTNHDKLTDLANRTYFSQTLEHFIKSADPKFKHAVVIFDINRFKIINDNLGQNNGDQLLISLAQRLKRITREDDFVARLGSDEFAILIKNAKNTQELNLSIHRIIYDLSQAYTLNKEDLFVDFSFGASIIEASDNNANQLMSHANIARNQAKQQGNQDFLYYQSEMNAESKHQLTLENDLRKALERNEIEVYYQPQVFGDTLKPYGAEALVRWNHATQGIISPVVFIPLAESTGLIVEIGRFVMQSAIKELEQWEAQGFHDLHIGINLSGRQFSHDNLMREVQTMLTQTTIRPEQLDLEITESLAMSDADHNISVLNGLKALGVSISIDDFGTGYSSLAYLTSFPIDTIKIDRSFILNLETKEGQAIVNTIIAMANSLGLSVVAEGIEEEHQLSFLQAKNCNVLQGYMFGKPLKSHEMQAFLVAQNP